MWGHDQLVPGHPHFWEESGKTYLGYDYRAGCLDEARNPTACNDVMGIRQVEWVEDPTLLAGQGGWPTIWRKITVEFTVPTGSALVGQQVGLSMRNIGDDGSTAAFDLVNLAVTTSAGSPHTHIPHTPHTHTPHTHTPHTHTPLNAAGDFDSAVNEAAGMATGVLVAAIIVPIVGTLLLVVCIVCLCKRRSGAKLASA